ncbi:MAG: SpaA isopeptide-forming pilin-related protein, partial [Bariatricus sp.]
DDEGFAYVKNLPLGEYYVKESAAPEGFVHNDHSEKAVFVYADQSTPVVYDQVSFTNERQKVSITVEKQDADNGNVVSGAVFGIYNTEDIINKDGDVIVNADTLLQEITSDDEGQANCTLDLPLGKYYVKELKAPAGFVSSDEILTFDASYQGQDVQTVELKAVKKNEPTVVEITKSDITTGVELDGAYLQVIDQDGNVIDSWESSKEEPHVIKYLTAGETYTLREEFAPYGYLVANDITFTVEDTAEIQKVEMKDEVPVAELILNKKGEFLDDVSLVDQVKGIVEHIFHYITGSLTDVTFEVYAEEDIKAADGVSEDYYKADELVATITTDETGIAKLSNLPLGKYYVKEVGTAHGYVLDSEIRHVDLSYVDQNTPVVTYNEDWQNYRQRVVINLVKKEKDQDRVLEGGVFGLYAKEDIKSSTTGRVLIEADEIIELKTTDAEGKITFVADLPIDAEYYVKELYAPAGFVNAEEVQEFAVSYAGEKEDAVVVDLTFEDEATTVEITKTDLTGGKEIPGCKLKLVDEAGNTVEEWTSTEEAHVIKELVVGKKYTLVETQPADGYVTAESIEFTVENTAEIQKHQMKDDVTKVEISKQDIAGKELPGAKLTILDKDGKVVESWISTEKAHYIEMLPIGKYTLREETAPDGYLVANDVEFEVKDTGEVQHVTMVDEAKPSAPAADTPKTGDDRNMKLWLILLGISAGGIGAAFGIRRKRK